MFKLILFDLGGVLFTNGTKKFIVSLSRRYDIPVERLMDVFDGTIGSQYREGEISRDQFWKAVLTALPIKESADVLEAEWISQYELLEDTKKIILALRNNYTVMYLSDNVKERAEALDAKFGFMSWFDGGIFSHDVGVRKPNPKIYEVALQKGHALAHETIFIDDKEKMLVPAKEMGIITILFESSVFLKRDLKKLGCL